MAGKQQNSDSANSNKNAISDEEVRQHSSEAADAAFAAQKKAAELKEAAAGPGDADERQKLMEQAINAQIEAESFGKTAKYLRSGTFQGLVVGTGLGVAPGASLGALTGTLVGGVTSTITGGLGGGIGAVTGAVHGPFVDLGEAAGKGVQKVTGNLPSWAATEEQKKTLEKMVGQVNEQDMPSEQELEKLKGDGGGGGGGEDLASWVKSAKGMIPEMRSQNQEGQQRKKPRKLEARSESSTAEPDDSANRRKPHKLEVKSNGKDAQPAEADNSKRPPKLESNSDGSNKPSTQSVSTSAKGQPRKLEKRSS